MGVVERIGVVLSLVFALSPIAYGASDARGASLFQEHGCIACHSIDGQGGQVGPTLDTVGDRYAAEWIYEWLRNPAAVKPGSIMPKPELTDEERAMLVFFLETKRSGETRQAVAMPVSNTVATNPPDLNPQAPENDYLGLGVTESYVEVQRFTIQDQIQSFIPPLYAPAMTQSAFVLPPGAVRIAVTSREVSMDEGDVSGQAQIGARFVDFDLERNFTDLDLFLGLNNNYTLRVNIPYLSSRVSQELNPGFLDPISVFPTASTSELGDISVFLKKKFFDQGNFPFSFAGVAALRFPTGSNDEVFNARTTVDTPAGSGLLPLPAVDAMGMPIPGTADGTFRRFADDGRLPAPLQPGLGTLGGSVGLFATRIFEGNTIFGRGAVHMGALYNIRPDDDGVDPGNQLNAFISLVKPIFHDSLSLDLTYLIQDQETDSYGGLMAVPSLPPVMPPMVMGRPSFSGGTAQFAGVSLVIIPNPLFQVTLSGLFRVEKPELGPSPDSVVRLNFQYTLASGLFK